MIFEEAVIYMRAREYAVVNIFQVLHIIPIILHSAFSGALGTNLEILRSWEIFQGKKKSRKKRKKKKRREKNEIFHDFPINFPMQKSFPKISQCYKFPNAKNFPTNFPTNFPKLEISPQISQLMSQS